MGSMTNDGETPKSEWPLVRIVRGGVRVDRNREHRNTTGPKTMIPLISKSHVRTSSNLQRG